MNYELMKARINGIEKLEKNMMRSLTDEEKTFVMENGVDSFIEDKLGFDHDDDFTFKRIKTLISSYCTQNYDEFVKEALKDNGYAVEVLKTIVNTIEDTLEENAKISELPANKEDYTEEDYDNALRMLSDLLKIDINKRIREQQEQPKLKCAEECKCEIFNRVTDCEGDCENCDWITYLIGLLKKGEELELSPEEIESICDRLHETENNYAVKIINNKISAKF